MARWEKIHTLPGNENRVYEKLHAGIRLGSSHRKSKRECPAKIRQKRMCPEKFQRSSSVQRVDAEKWKKSKFWVKMIFWMSSKNVSHPKFCVFILKSFFTCLLVEKIKNIEKIAKK